MKRRVFCSGERDPGQALERWFDTPLGEILLQQERARLRPLLSGLFGYYLLQVGFPCLRITPELAGRTMPVLVTPELPPARVGGWVCGDPLQLPVAGDSVDAVLLWHTLDFTHDPRQLLREAERVLIAEGRLIVVGFNPWSLWGGWRLLHSRRHIPWCGHFFSQGRLHDWLSLLGFELEQSDYLMFRPPLQQRLLMERLQGLEQLGQRSRLLPGGVYILEAVKRVAALTPLKPPWKLRQALLGGPGIEPTVNTPSPAELTGEDRR